MKLNILKILLDFVLDNQIHIPIIILIENIRGKTIQVDHLLGIALHGPRCWHRGRVVAFGATTPVQIQDGKSYSHEKFNAYSSER